jgi:hypothetical protein
VRTCLNSSGEVVQTRIEPGPLLSSVLSNAPAAHPHDHENIGAVCRVQSIEMSRVGSAAFVSAISSARRR